MVRQQNATLLSTPHTLLPVSKGKGVYCVCEVLFCITPHWCRLVIFYNRI